jgi:peptidylprolyl isomerase
MTATATATATALTRSIFCSCLLVSLAACIEPPSAADSAKATAAAQPAVGGEQQKSPISAEPGFTGAPVSTATLAGGLIVDDFLIGTGEEAKPGSEVSVQYTGTLDDGTVFDTSKTRNRPYTFTVGEGRVIKGWDQGLPGMKVGGKRRLTVPSDLAYGPRAKGKIPANSQLTFTIELIEVVPPLPDAKGDEAFAGEPLQKSELEGGLMIEDFALGEGRVAASGDNVDVHYTGRLDDGTVFDSSVPRKKAIAFVLGTGRVIKGWDLGIAGMKVGGLRRLTIPAELAYGPRAKGKIPADSRLTFTVELMSIRDPSPQPPARARPPH